jgi:hypothetical protein
MRKAARQGIADCVRRLTHPPIANIGIRGLKKWADLLVHAKDPKGWPRVFPPGLPLYATLMYVFVSIEISGTGGSGFRRMYADFLEEVSGPLGEKAFVPAVGLYRQAAQRWKELAEAALPDSIAPFAETRELLRRKNDLFERRGAEALDEMRKINDRLDAIRTEVKEDFPLDRADVQGLLEDLRARVLDVYQKETEAAETLRAAL